MNKDTLNKYRLKYKKELESYTFPEDYYDYIINNNPRKSDTLNDRRNRSILVNTPKEFFICNERIIYYDSVKELNNNMNEWIEIFNVRAKTLDDINLIYDYYIKILVYINREIEFFIKVNTKKYDIKYPILPDTLVKNYIDILMGRSLKIKNKLRFILEKEFNLYYDYYGNEILDLFNNYQSKILSIEEESDELYNEFRNEVNNILNKHKVLNKVKEGYQWNYNKMN